MKRTAPNRLTVAFTLVELLVVIAIIVILMSLLLTAVPAVREAARKADAGNTSHMVVTAINSYYTEYARFPPTDDPSKEAAAGPVEDIIVGDPDMGASLPNNTVFYTLRSIPKGPNDAYIANPRKVVFYEGKAASVNASNRARGGFFDKTSSGSNPPPAQESCLFDPWGKQYGVVFDATGDDRIDLKSYYTDFTGVEESGKAPRRKAGCFSMGKDEMLGNKGDKAYRNGTEKSDDVVSWE